MEGRIRKEGRIMIRKDKDKEGRMRKIGYG